MKFRTAHLAALALAAGFFVGCKEKIHHRPHPEPEPGPVVVGSGVTGQVLTRNGRAVEGLVVEFRRDDGVWRDRTNRRGVYQIAPLPADRRGYVRFTYDGRRYEQKVETPRDGFARVDFTVRGGDRPHPPRPQPQPQPEPVVRCTVEGRVYRGDEPWAQATVHLQIEGEGREWTTVAGKKGVYRFSDVPGDRGGRVYVVERRRRFEQRIRTARRGTMKAPNIVVPMGPRPPQPQPKPKPKPEPAARCTLEGRVYRGDKPWAQATVHLQIEGEGREWTTAAGKKGVYRFRDVPGDKSGRVYVVEGRRRFEQRIRTALRGTMKAPNIVVPTKPVPPRPVRR